MRKKKTERNDQPLFVPQVQLKSPTRVIKLNVGGKKFYTSLSTLTIESDSMLAAMFSGKFDLPIDEEGFIFIDRDPTSFGYILNYLRGYGIFLKARTEEEIEMLKKDSDFYGLSRLSDILNPPPSTPPPSPTLHWDPSKCGGNITLSKGNRVATKISGGCSWNSCVLGNRPCNCFLVTIVNRGTGGDVMVGMAPQCVDTNGRNFNRHGWYIYCFNGNLYSQDGAHGNFYADSIPTGSTIEVTLKKRNLSFKIDGRDHGVAYTGLPEALYPVADIYDQGAVIEIKEVHRDYDFQD